MLIEQTNARVYTYWVLFSSWIVRMVPHSKGATHTEGHHTRTEDKLISSCVVARIFSDHFSIVCAHLMSVRARVFEFGRQRKFHSDPKSEPTLKLSGRISCCWHSSQTRPLMLTGFSTKAVQWRTNQSTGQVCTTRAQHDYGSTGELLEHGGNWNGKEKCSDHGKVADQANRNRQATASGVP